LESDFEDIIKRSRNCDFYYKKKNFDKLRSNSLNEKNISKSSKDNFKNIQYNSKDKNFISDNSELLQTFDIDGFLLRGSLLFFLFSKR